MTAGLIGPLSPLVPEDDFGAFAQLDLKTFTIRTASPTFLAILEVEKIEDAEGILPARWLDRSTAERFLEILSSMDTTGRSSDSMVGHILRRDGSLRTCEIQIRATGSSMVHLHLKDFFPDGRADEILRLSIELDRRIQKGHSLEALLTLSARQISENFSFLFSYFVIPEPDGSLRFIAIESRYPKLRNHLKNILSGTRWDTLPGKNLPCTIAFRTLMPCFLENLSPQENPLLEEIASTGARSILSLPILFGKKNIPKGVLTVGAVSLEEMSLPVRDRLTDLSEKIGLAVANYEYHAQITTEKDALFDQAPDGIYITDAETFLILDANRMFCELLGYPDKSFIVGHSLMEFTSASREDILDAINELERSGKESSMVRRRFLRKNGAFFPVSISFSRLSYQGKNAYMSHVRDITRDMEAEAVRRISNTLDRQILDGAPLDDLLTGLVDGIADSFGFPLVYFAQPSPDGTIRYVHIRTSLPGIRDVLDAAAKTMKWNTPPGSLRMSSRALASRAPVFALIESQDKSPLLKDFFRSGIRASFIIPILKEDALLLPWGLLTLSTQHEENLSQRIRDLLLDMAEKVRMAFLRFDEQNHIRLQRTAMESARSPFLITSPDGSVEWANAAFFCMIGQPDDDKRPLSLPDLFPETVGTDPPMTLFEIVRAGLFFEGEIPGRSHSGDTFITETIVSPILDDQNRLSHMLIHMKDVTLEKVQEKALWELAHVDSLTGLPNWNAFMETLDREFRQAREENRRMAVFYLDLDGFKEINDTMGHETGNVFLRAIAGRLRQCPSLSDSVARIGGDEFVLLCKRTGEFHTLQAEIRTLTDLVSRPVEIDGRSFQTTVSIGVAFYPDDAEKSADLVRKADIAMYQAKKSKKGWRFFDQEMEERIQERYRNELSLRQALRSGQIFLMFQPQIDLAKRRLRGIEALVRWKNAEGIILTPKSFIALAEESGIILELGEIVFEQSFETLHRWETLGLRDFRLSVNVSPRQFWSKNFWDGLSGRIARQPEAGNRLCLELTESLLMQNPDEIGKRLSDLRTMGVRIAIDDFGTGYSSLAYLSRFPVDEIKVPQEFVLRMKTHEQDRMIVRTIIQMAISLGIDLVGEGAETRAEIDMLFGLGCTTIQGYGLARPMPIENLEDFVRHPDIWPFPDLFQEEN